MVRWRKSFLYQTKLYQIPMYLSMSVFVFDMSYFTQVFTISKYNSNFKKKFKQGSIISTAQLFCLLRKDEAVVDTKLKSKSISLPAINKKTS